MSRSLRAALSAVLAAVVTAAAAAGDPGAPAVPKTLRTYFPSAETGFDPAQTNDIYSRTVTAHVFEAPYRYDHLARPIRIRPNTAVAMPEVSDDFRVYTFRIRPGIYFQDHPVFGGNRRELTAADYVYSWKRFVDPIYKSPAASELQEYKIVGLNALRKAAEQGRPFDYDTPIDGLRAVGRYTVRIQLEEPRPRLLELLANNSQMGALAREVVEQHRTDIMAQPVGTGPYRLASWRRSSQIVLERNPAYRELYYDEQPAADDAYGQRVAARLRGKRLPIVDRVEIAIIEQAQPLWLAFLNGELDHLAVPGEFVAEAMPGGELAPKLARRGVRAVRTLNPDSVYFYFNMKDPLWGGMGADKVALRRAMSLAIDTPRIIDTMYRGQAIASQSPLTPHTSGYDPAFKSEMGEHDPVRARALLDLYGYIDRDGDGIREAPDGRPLVVTAGSQTDQFSRQLDEILTKNFKAVGVRYQVQNAQWAEHLRAARAGKLQMWRLGGSATVADGIGSIARLYEELQRLPDGPDRERLFREAKRIAAVYVPYKFIAHRIATDLTAPALIGHRRTVFWRDWYQFVDIDRSPDAR